MDVHIDLYTRVRNKSGILEAGLYVDLKCIACLHHEVLREIVLNGRNDSVDEF